MKMMTMDRRSLLILHLLIVMWNIDPTNSSHFYGGTVTWKPVNNVATGSTVDVMFTQSYQWRRSWTSGSGSGFCDQTIIQNKSPLIPNTGSTLNCITGVCGGYTSIPINEYCTDFSTLVDTSSGQISTVKTINVGSQFCVAYQDSAWIRVLSTNCPSSGRKKRAVNSSTLCFDNSADWSIGTCVNLTMRAEGFINTPPVATVISPINVMIDTITEIQIPVIDSDNDFLRCRWATQNSTFNECGDVCQTVPGATLHPDNCSITFNSTGSAVDDYFAVTLMVEDFSNENSTTPFSSIPIQFLIHVVNASSCFIKPTINSSLPACSVVEVGVRFNFTLFIEQGCPGTNLTDVFTMPPLYMYKGAITPSGTGTSWTVSETWIANSSQLGSQVFCALATDSDSIQSDQYCLTFMVIPTGSNQQCPGVTTIPTTVIISSGSSTITTTTSKPAAQSWTGLIIGLSVLGFLGLLTACCCCWWWIFGRAALARRRRRRLDKTYDVDHPLQPIEKPFSSNYHPSRTPTFHSGKASVISDNREISMLDSSGKQSAIHSDVRQRQISSAHSNRLNRSRSENRNKTGRIQHDYDNDGMSDTDQLSKISDNSTKPIIPPPSRIVERFDENNTNKDPETISIRSQRRFSFSVARVPRPESRARTEKRGRSTDVHQFQDHRSNLSAVPNAVSIKKHPSHKSSSKPSTKISKVIQTRIRPKK